MRQFGFIIALVQTNAFLMYNFSRTQKGLEELSKAEFIRDLCKEMVQNEEYKKAMAGKQCLYEKRTC